MTVPKIEHPSWFYLSPTQYFSYGRSYQGVRGSLYCILLSLFSRSGIELFDPLRMSPLFSHSVASVPFVTTSAFCAHPRHCSPDKRRFIGRARIPLALSSVRLHSTHRATCITVARCVPRSSTSPGLGWVRGSRSVDMLRPVPLPDRCMSFQAACVPRNRRPQGD